METLIHVNNVREIVPTPLGMTSPVPIVVVNVVKIYMGILECALHALIIAPMPLEIHMAAKLVHAHVMRIITV